MSPRTGVATFLAMPRRITLMALTPTISLQARTHRPHSTQAFSSGSRKRTSVTPNSSASAAISGEADDPASSSSAVTRRLRWTSGVSVYHLRALLARIDARGHQAGLAALPR